MEDRHDDLAGVQSIKLEQDDFIITTDSNGREAGSPDSMDFKPDMSPHPSSGHEIPLPSIFASPVKNAPLPPAAESPTTPRTKYSYIEEYPLPTVNSPVKQEPLLSVSEIPSSPDSSITTSNLNMPSLTPSPAKKRPVSSLRLKAHLQDHSMNTVEKKPERIQCICGFEYNDGFLVQCNKCSVWQHVDCFYTNASNCPTDHRCHVCVPRYVDYENAKQIQNSKMNARSRLTELVFDSDSAFSMRYPNPLPVPPPSRPSKRKQSLIARSTPDPRLMHTDDLISISDIDCIDSRHRRYKKIERNRYTEDLIKQMSRFHGNAVESVKRNLATELSTKECETAVSQNMPILIASGVLSLYDTVIEYRGEFMLKDEYLEKQDPTREYNPYVLFYSGLNNMTIVVNASKSGNEARFVRRCCKPNCEVKHTFGENNRLHLVIWATQKITAGKELTIPFDFDYKECNYNVVCPCNRKNCDVRRWCQSRMFHKSYTEGDRLEKNRDITEYLSNIPKRLKLSVQKTGSVKLEDVKKETDNSNQKKTNGRELKYPTDYTNFEITSLISRSKFSSIEDVKPVSKLSSTMSTVPSSSAPVPAPISRIKSDAEARASLTARLQERLSPSKPNSVGASKTICPSSPRSLFSTSNNPLKSEQKLTPIKPSSPGVQRFSPLKQQQQQQQQQSRRSRRKQQFVDLRNPFVEDGNRSSDDEPEGLGVWSIDGLHHHHRR